MGQVWAANITPHSYAKHALAAPATVTSRTHLYMYTTVGSASPSISFNVSGTDMQDGITIVPAPGNYFEISTDNVNFTNSPIVIGAAGNIAATQIYVRLRAGLPSIGAGYTITSGALQNGEEINSITITFDTGALPTDGVGIY